MGSRRVRADDVVARGRDRRRLPGYREGRAGTVAAAHDRRSGVVTTVATGASYTPNTTIAADDIRSSPLWNPDLAPTPLSRRTWSTYNIAALWIGMSVVITTYTLASGMMTKGMTWWQAMVTILLGNTIVLIPMVLKAHAGTMFGMSLQRLCS